MERPAGNGPLQARRPRWAARGSRVRPRHHHAGRPGRAPARRSPCSGPMAGSSDGARRHRHMGVGHPRARLDRSARHADRAPARRAADVGSGRRGHEVVTPPRRRPISRTAATCRRRFAAMGTGARIRWAPKLRTDRLVRLYQDNARGLLDAGLVDDVGWRLWERLADVLRVTGGRVACPACGTEFQVRVPGGGPDEARVCPTCGWATTAADWHRSWEHRDLNGNCPDFEAFVDAYPKAVTTRDRMLLIDTVVHALHRTAKGDVS